MTRKPRSQSWKQSQEIADKIIAQRKRSIARRKKALKAHRSSLIEQSLAAGQEYLGEIGAVDTKGYLIAAGDSWFDYPGELFSRDDVLELLEETGYDVESTAHAGDPIETIAYGANTQLCKLATCFEKVNKQNAIPKAILLSGGGDDIAGTEFGMLVNDAKSPIAGWNNEVVDGVINQRIRTSYVIMLNIVDRLSQQYAGRTLPILIHGYDYAVPDGRGFAGGWGPLPGPWLQPGFNEKQFKDLKTMTSMIQDLIDRFNTMLQKLAQEPAYKGHVHYVNLRKTLPNTLPGRAYTKWWANELHPAPIGFRAVTKKFIEVLETL